LTDRLFVYGTLKPGASAWRLLEPFTAGDPVPATLPGVLYDTGRGYPALLLDELGEVPGWLVTLESPGAALSAMDDYEGTEYQRILVTLPDGAPCWTYVWIEAIDGMRRLEVW
jgi:gamma-glutamylcyclotransferase (GGCT)/AIG2-like uncharacterized protein YtfP